MGNPATLHLNSVAVAWINMHYGYSVQRDVQSGVPDTQRDNVVGPGNGLLGNK